ncbi:MAG: c-type cytochrome [Verrucomicrobiales bacterium]|nr:c-type cytochrome [Verrucomicrobiales bacterium]
MYRFVLEHPEWISPEMQARLELRAGEDRGRIYRVVPVGSSRRTIPDLARLSGASLAAAMDHPNGWRRDMVQRLILERGDAAAVEGLPALTSLSRPPQVRLQALATLGLAGKLDESTLRRMLADPHPWVRVEALRRSERFAIPYSPLFDAVSALARDGDAAVRMQAAYSLGAWPHAEPVLSEMAASDGGDEWIRTAVMSSLDPNGALFREMSRKGAEGAPKAAVVVAGREPSSPDRAAVVASYAGVEKLEGDAARGRAQFETLCASCHRLKGLGSEVGPDLAMVGTKPVDWMLVAILDPGGAVEARYRGWSLALRDGEILEGLVSGETANNLVIKQAGGVETAVLRSDILSLEPMKGSLMPGGFEAVLPPQGMADLLRWMRSP